MAQNCDSDYDLRLQNTKSLVPVQQQVTTKSEQTCITTNRSRGVPFGSPHAIKYSYWHHTKQSKLIQNDHNCLSRFSHPRKPPLQHNTKTQLPGIYILSCSCATNYPIRVELNHLPSQNRLNCYIKTLCSNYRNRRLCTLRGAPLSPLFWSPRHPCSPRRHPLPRRVGCAEPGFLQQILGYFVAPRKRGGEGRAPPCAGVGGARLERGTGNPRLLDSSTSRLGLASGSVKEKREQPGREQTRERDRHP